MTDTIEPVAPDESSGSPSSTIGPDASDSRLQFNPISKARTIPETTPRPNATPKILSQNCDRLRKTACPVSA